MKAAVVGNRARFYTPGTAIRDYRHSIKEIAEAGWSQGTMTGPIKLVCHFGFPLPLSKHKKREPVQIKPRTSKPDLDNLVKGVKDALTDAGVWRDDAQVTECHAFKWDLGQEEPMGYTEIFVTRAAEEE